MNTSLLSRMIFLVPSMVMVGTSTVLAILVNPPYYQVSHKHSEIGVEVALACVDEAAELGLAAEQCVSESVDEECEVEEEDDVDVVSSSDVVVPIILPHDQEMSMSNQTVAQPMTLDESSEVELPLLKYGNGRDSLVKETLKDESLANCRKHATLGVLGKWYIIQRSFR